MDKLFSMVEIEVNSNCNRKCVYCPNLRHERKEKGDMEPAVFKKIISQLQDIAFSGRISYHFYGEPLLCKYLTEYVSLTKKSLPNTRRVIYSNGDLLYKKNIYELIESGVTRFVITLHEGRGNDFQKTLGELPDEVTPYIEFLQHRSLILTNRGGKLDNGYKGTQLSVPCYIPSSLLIVTVKGNVLPCFEDYDQSCVMGNINEEHLLDIWRKHQYISYRNELRSGNRAYCQICLKCDNHSVHDDKQFDFVL